METTNMEEKETTQAHLSAALEELARADINITAPDGSVTQQVPTPPNDKVQSKSEPTVTSLESAAPTSGTDSAGPTSSSIPTSDSAGPISDSAGPTSDSAGPTSDSAGPTSDSAGPTSGSTSDYTGPTSNSANTVVSSYRDYEQEAQQLVEKILQQAMQAYKQELANMAPDIDWPTGDGFTIEKAKDAINTLVKSWPVGESWEYCIDYLHHDNNLHCFAVKYSEPTRRKPVPRATASVYFYLLVHGKENPVTVKYVLEGQRLSHRPTDTVFREVWLRNVIRNKLTVSGGLNLMAL